MSLKAMTLVSERSRAKGSNLVVLLAIADYARDDGKWAFPGAGLLAWRGRLTRRAGELILTKLVADGELTPEWSGAERRLYLHVRCIYDWPAYQAEGPTHDQCEKFSHRLNEKFSMKLVELGSARANGRAGSAKFSAPSAKNADRYKEDPSDPLDPIRAGDGLAAAPVDPCGKPDEGKEAAKPLAVITKVVHTVGDLLGPFDTLGDLTEAVKSFCARPPGGGDPIPYDSDVVRRAIDSASVQRARAHRRPMLRLEVHR
jgi:hypothetical protein